MRDIIFTFILKNKNKIQIMLEKNNQKLVYATFQLSC